MVGLDWYSCCAIGQDIANAARYEVEVDVDVVVVDGRRRKLERRTNGP